MTERARRQKTTRCTRRLRANLYGRSTGCVDDLECIFISFIISGKKRMAAQERRVLHKASYGNPFVDAGGKKFDDLFA